MFRISALFAIILIAPAAFGAKSFVDSGNGLWSDGNNWSPAGVPGSTENVTIADAGEATVDYSTALSSNLYLGNTTDGALNIIGGELNIASWFYLGSNGANGTCVMSGGTVNVNQHVAIGYSQAANGNFEMSGGTLNVTGQYSVFGVGWNGHGNCTISSGTVNARILAVPLTDTGTTGSGSLHITGGTIECIYEFRMKAGGTCDISGDGQIIIDTDRRTMVQQFVDAGWLTGNGGTSPIIIDYIDGKTIVHTTDNTVDTLDYFLPTADPLQLYAWGGSDIRACQDPDKGGANTYILNKFNGTDVFEIYKITDTEIQIRYEIQKRKYGRRFEETGRSNTGSGHVWMKRQMTPGGPGYLTTYRIDYSAWNSGSSTYTWTSNGSTTTGAMFNTVKWATDTWPLGNDLGFGSEAVLRLTQEWQQLGRVMEDYDYKLGRGPVNWRWLGNFDWILTSPYNGSTFIFSCSDSLHDYVYVQSRGSDTVAPVVYDCDSTGKKYRQLEVIRLQSYWITSGQSWYVVTRDLSKEQRFAQTAAITFDMRLTEWLPQMKTIYDLAYKNTSKPPVHVFGDINGDGTVDELDLVILTDQWLGLPQSPCADITTWPNGDRKINFKDFSVLADDWKK